MQKNSYPYPVEFIEDVFGQSSAFTDILMKVCPQSPRVLIVADENVVRHTPSLGVKIGRWVQEKAIDLASSPVVLSGGEKLKSDNLQSAMRIVTSALEAKLSVNDCIVAIGGGALLDVAGYAAAQVRGGVKLVRIPTTPAAMMDAAFASYAAVNGVNVKDAMRVASVPEAAVIDVKFADSVLDGVWRAGIGEAVRFAMVSDGTLMKKLLKLTDKLRERNVETMSEVIKSVALSRLKKGSVDFAQWAAFRLEAMSGYKLPHGYAIGMGICIDTAYSVAKGYMKEKDALLVTGMLKESGALEGLQHSGHLLTRVDGLLHGLDAWKLSLGREQIILPAGIGKMKVETEIDRATMKEALNLVK
jgi:3-dehydroquinate synthase